MRYLLFVVLLLASVCNVQAGAIFSIGTVSFQTNCPSLVLSGPFGGAQLDDPGNGVQGMKVYGQASATCGPTSDYPGISYGANGDVTVDEGGFPASLPVSWNFTASLALPDFTETAVDTGTFSLLMCAGNDCRSRFTLDGIWMSGVAVTGQGFLDAQNPWYGDDQWNVQLSIYYAGSLPTGTEITLDIPEDSIDLNPAGGISAVPEPVSFGLFAGGLGALALLRRRRR